jgi:hypothetical protein
MLVQTERWITDTELFNEWMNEIDYEVSEEEEEEDQDNTQEQNQIAEEETNNNNSPASTLHNYFLFGAAVLATAH